ncbi:hypothetical protein [Jannaschia sp. CCS1]|uniref:hypothetical protein n=1 Tax=Jannaschia sp. (strain CCS1) TaxID=290400 RepID=UPI000053D143|nr:hypothetical protein [Jannaschia sp. CCS1]ABD55254.1 hypothetical protein Jann_2337 [Jannaschia sp. CCS1]
MRHILTALILCAAPPAIADTPVIRVPPQVPASAEADRSDPVAWQTAMPSIAVRAGFLAEKEERGEDGEFLQRRDNLYGYAEEVFFYVSLTNVARADVGQPGATFAVALRAQVRDADGAPLSDWLDVHTYTGTMTMGPDDPEYFDTWVTGGLGPELPPGTYQLALEFTDTLRTDPAAQAPVEVVFDLLYPDQ